MSLSLSLEQSSSRSLFATLNRPTQTQQSAKDDVTEGKEAPKDVLTQAIEQAEKDKATIDLIQSALEESKRKADEDLKGVRDYQKAAEPKVQAKSDIAELGEALRVEGPNSGLTEPFGGLPEGFSFQSASSSYSELKADGLSARFGELQTVSVDSSGISFNSVKVSEAQVDLDNGSRVTVQQLQIRSVYIGSGSPSGGQVNRSA